MFGAPTQGAVLDFQQALGVAPDDIVGPIMLRRLPKCEQGPAGNRRGS
ncbi:MAG: peptidoglycan-binding protein [Gaiellaceae bacterium]